MGKKKLGDSDSEDLDGDDSDEDEVEETNKSVVTENGDLSDSSKEADRSSGSVTDTQRFVAPSESGSEEEKEMVDTQSQNPDENSGDHSEHPSLSQHDLGASKDKISEEAIEFCLETAIISGTTEDEVSKQLDYSNVVERVSQPSTLSSSGEEETTSAEVNGKCISETGIQEEVVTMNAEASDSEKPLDLQAFNSASELEDLGMERLKLELQLQGLKCGGTLQERAARLFLLKTTPLEMLPKKLLAKK